MNEERTIYGFRRIINIQSKQAYMFALCDIILILY